MPLWIVKLGGNILDDAAMLAQVLATLAGHPGPVVLVHGGGKAATRLAERLGIAQTMVQGRRVTDAATLDVAVMVYAGLLNKQIVAGLQARGRNALGLSGADGNAIRATRRPPGAVDYGLVGDLHSASINTALLDTLLGAGLTPVFCALSHDGAGQMLNTNADTLAQALAVALSTRHDTRLLYLFEKRGVLQDLADPSTLIPRIAVGEVETLVADGTLADGMVPKIRNAAQAVTQGVGTVLIGQASALSIILQDHADACTRVVA